MVKFSTGLIQLLYVLMIYKQHNITRFSTELKWNYTYQN